MKHMLSLSVQDRLLAAIVNAGLKEPGQGNGFEATH
jgi:hypothetical protein